VLDAIKAFMQGWSEQGKHPTVSPDLVRAYVDTATACLSDESELDRLCVTVATGASEVAPFMLTYTTMPFVIGSVCAYTAPNSNESKFSAIHSSLVRFGGQFHANAPDVSIADAFPLDAELEDMVSYFRREGNKQSKQTLISSLISRRTAASYMIRVRTTAMTASLGRNSTGHLSGSELPANFALFAGTIFAHSCTKQFSRAKGELFAESVSKAVALFSRI
jgi:hypothetical protein